jgi:hypothetical protein
MARPKFESIDVSIVVDAGSVARAKKELKDIPNGIIRAVDGAIKKTLVKSKTMVVGQLASILTAKQSAIRRTPSGKERITTTPVHDGEGGLEIMGRRIGAINFLLVKTSVGYRVQYFKSGGIGVDRPGAFIGVGIGAADAGNRQVFVRYGKDKHRVQNPHYRPNKNRMMQSINTVKGLSLFDVYKGRSRWGKEVENFMAEDFETQLLSQTDRLLGRKKTERE